MSLPHAHASLYDSANRLGCVMHAVEPSGVSPSFGGSTLHEVVDNISRKIAKAPGVEESQGSNFFVSELESRPG